VTRSLLTLADLAARPSRVDELAPEQALGLLVAIASLQPLLMARALVPCAPKADPSEPIRLLTVPEAAERLNIPRSYLYELVRLGRVPAQRIGPKYVRLNPATVAEIQEKGLDGRIGLTYSRRRDGTGIARPPGTARAHPGRARGAGRRDGE
jgi:excisionase family DNA binding protein